MKNISFPEIQESFGLIDKSFLGLYWHYFLIAALLLLCLVVIFYYIFKPREKKISPYEKAMLFIKSLKEANLEDKLFVISLSNILRDFLAQRYNLPAPERTTAEFLALLNKSIEIEKQSKEKLIELLQLSDMVKFANYNISQEQRALLLQNALELIEKSKVEKEGN